MELAEASDPRCALSIRPALEEFRVKGMTTSLRSTGFRSLGSAQSLLRAASPTVLGGLAPAEPVPERNMT